MRVIHPSTEIDPRAIVGGQGRGGAEGNVTIGANCHFSPYSCILPHGGNIVIGNDCTVGLFSILYGHGGLIIGNDVRISSHVSIIPAEHIFDRTDIPIRQQGIKAKGIVIGNDVWIGTGVRILDGVKIGSGVVIAAGAVVTESVEPFAVVAGVPARVIKNRLD